MADTKTPTDSKSVSKGGARRALLVGINDYPGFQSDLPSCVADVEAFGDMLSRVHGFEIETLVDSDATRAAVIDGLRRLCSGVTAADRICFFYSGHGAQVPRLDSIEECLVLADGSTLPDDDFVSAFAGNPAGTSLVVLDSCFSGGLSKGFGFAPAGLPKRIQLLTPQAQVGTAKTKYRPFGSKHRPRFGGFASLKKKALVEFDEGDDAQLNALLLSACLEGETAAASTAQSGGLSCFTYALLSAIAGGATSANELIADATDELRRIGEVQTPQIKEPPSPARLGDHSFPALQPMSKLGTARARLTERPPRPVAPNQNQDVPMQLVSAFLSGLTRALP